MIGVWNTVTGENVPVEINKVRPDTSRKAWFEINGCAYEVEGGEESFRYSLELLSHQYLRDAEIEAIELLRRSGLASDKQLSLCRFQAQLKDLRDNHIWGLRLKKRLFERNRRNVPASK